MTEKRFEFRLCSNGYTYLWKDNELFVTQKGDYITLEQDKGDIVDLLNELSEENKKLHHAIVETEKMVQSTYDELTKLRCFKKNILRIKHSWDYLMEAIQYD